MKSNGEETREIGELAAVHDRPHFMMSCRRQSKKLANMFGAARGFFK